MAKQSSRHVSDDGKQVWAQLENINRFGYGYSSIFGDWVDLMLNSLLSLTTNVHQPNIVELVRNNGLDDEFNRRYMEITRKYRENTTRPRGERPADYFATAFGLLAQETKEKQKDIIGQIYMERVTLGEGGQFFTPHEVANLMTQLTVGTEPNLEERICDPCCGSGRFLISMARERPNARFYGNDIDLRCAKMTALNMWLFDLNAVITCGNGLTDQWSIGYEIRRGGFIRELTPPTVPSQAEQEPAKAEAETPPPSPAQDGEEQTQLPL